MVCVCVMVCVERPQKIRKRAKSSTICCIVELLGSPPLRPFLTVDMVAVVDASTTATALLCRPYNEKKRRR